MRAYLFTVEADAWKRLMAELNIDPETLLRDLPCFDTIRHANDAIRQIAFTEEQATAFLREMDDEARPITVETVLEEMRAFLDRRIEWWQ
jgi:hypothetical protein